MKPNAELAWRVIDHIDAHPDQHDQEVWIRRGDGCGTVACLAGWACLLGGDQPDFHQDDPEASDVLTGQALMPVKERAAQLLGIPYDPDAFYGHALFNAYLTREDLGALVAEIFGPRPEPAPVPDAQRLVSCALCGQPLEDDNCPAECPCDAPPNAGSAS